MEDTTTSEKVETPETEVETKTPETEDTPEQEEPPVRHKTKQENREAYYRRKMEKAQKEAEDYKHRMEEKNDVNPEEVGLDDAIEAKINEKLSPRLDVLDRQQRKGEAAEYLEAVPEPVKKLYSKLKDKVWKYWDHESRRQLPFQSVLYEVIGPELIKEGARLSKEADAEATPAIGSNARQTGGTTDFSKMSSKDFKEWEKKHGITGSDRVEPTRKI